jgi:hypothetical protein
VPGERPLQLHAEPLRPERAQQAPRHRGGRGVLVALDPRGHGAVARAARQTDEPVRVALEVLEPRARRERVRRPVARALVRLRDQPAEVRVAGPVLAQERHVVAVLERQLGAHDRPHAERLDGGGELHRPVQPVVVGERDRRVPLLGRRRRDLDRMRGPVEEREGGVAVELDVRHGANTCSHSQGQVGNRRRDR